jgi:hypothetical protein
MKKIQKVWWHVTFTDDITNKINWMEKFPRYISWELWRVLQWDSKREIILWCDIFTDRITNGVIDGIILSIISLMIFNLWPDNRLSSPLPPFILLPYVFFSATKSHPSPNLNTTQTLTTISYITTLSLSVFMLWFKFY